MKSQPDNKKHQQPGSTSKSLHIVPEKQKLLSKDQRAFNRYTKIIKELQKELAEEAAHLEKLLLVYSKKIPGLLKERAGKQIGLAKALANDAGDYRFTKHETANIANVIIDLCNEAFSELEPDEDTITFFNQWSPITFQELLAEKDKILRETLAGYVKATTGFAMAPEDFDQSPEGKARLEEKLRSFQQQFDEDQSGAPPLTKKGKKEAEKAKKKKTEEVLKLKSIRSVYLLLAKTLHPDMVTDAAEKRHNEELMKRVTAAYDSNDLATLLQLEMEWVASETNNLQKLPAARLKAYTEALKAQALELENDLAALQDNPRFDAIRGFAGFSASKAVSMIHAFEKDLKTQTRAFNEIIRMFAKGCSRREILDFARHYINETMADDFAHDEVK